MVQMWWIKVSLKNPFFFFLPLMGVLLLLVKSSPTAVVNTPVVKREQQQTRNYITLFREFNIIAVLLQIAQ